MPFGFDPNKARANLRKHGISFAHAEQALRDPMALSIEDPDVQDERRMRWGGCWWSSTPSAGSGRA